MADTNPKSRLCVTNVLRTIYLIIYNATSAVAWLAVLLATITTVNSSRQEYQASGMDGITAWRTALSDGRLFARSNDYVRFVQTLALAEVAHSFLGIVRSPVFTTAMQVSSRLVLVWLVAFPFSAALLHEPFYVTMLLAWSVTEVIRYTYFTVMLANLPMPSPLKWLRYNTFTVLYPLGITSECVCIYRAIPFAAAATRAFRARAGVNPLTHSLDQLPLDKVMIAILVLYIPGSYTLYSYMLKQRRRS